MKLAANVAAVALCAGLAVAAQDDAHNHTPASADDLEARLVAALEADPTDVSSMLRLGLLMQTEGRFDEGAAWLQAAYKADPDLAQDHFIEAPAPRGGTDCNASTGPDVIVGSLPNIGLYGHEGPAQNGISAFGIATTSCNIGDEILLWQSSNSNHPVIAQNIYRVMDGRFTQIGVGWLKHGFLALSGNLCCSCTGGGGSQLSPGCSDPYSAGLNASQGGLGPRFEVNATTGVFPYPFTSPSYNTSIARRCQAADADLDPARNPGARWFMEGHYIAADDAAAGNGLNNASWREISFFQSGSGYSASNVGSTVREQPAIKAWPVVDSRAEVVDIDVPSDGRFHVGNAVIDNGDGTWRYEYAVHNLNSDRSAQAFSVPVPAGVTITDAGFNDVDYHSGEPWDGTDWTFNRTSGFATWSTTPYSVNDEANALRWGTAYSFWFTADAPPAQVQADLRLFKPGDVDAVPAAVRAPMSSCPADLDGSGAVDAGDLAELISAWGSAGAADLDGSGTVGASDLAALLSAWGSCVVPAV
jgi:hypothetical protein